MVKRINILTQPLDDQNARAFLAPLLANRRLFRASGIRFHIYEQPTPELTDCDVLMINSAYWRAPWVHRRSQALDLIANLAERVPETLFFDRSSTSSTVNSDILPLVKRYYKTNLLRDRSQYQKALYGQRQFTDYYHHQYGVVDPAPTWSMPVDDASELSKLRTSWNTALANYSLLGPRISALYKYVPFAPLMRPASAFTRPSADRSIDVSCRMGLTYKYETVAYQRRRLAETLQRYRRTERVSKIAYFRELRDSKVVTSPFGYSEVNYKDFETFITGGLLLKPDMSHLETYPNFYEADVTYLAHDWDLSDLEEKVENVLAEYPRYLQIAENGQNLYREHTVGRNAHERFVKYFLDLLAEAKEVDMATPSISRSQDAAR
jgi:hypothetical protein